MRQLRSGNLNFADRLPKRRPKIQGQAEMIHIERHIQTVKLSFAEAKLLPSLPHIQSSARPITSSVPADITFNEAWTVHHECACGDPGVSFSPTHNWAFINRLFSRFHTYDFLETLAEAFDSLRVLEPTSSEFMFLTTADFDDATASILQIPQVTFNHYACEACGGEFLCRLSQGHPIQPDPRHPKGREGRLIVHEIAQIGWEGRDFQTLLRMGRGYDE